MKLNETSQMFNNSSASVDQGSFVEQHGLFVACVFVDSINITFCTLIISIGLADCEDIISYSVTDTVCSTNEDSSVEVTENVLFNLVILASIGYTKDVKLDCTNCSVQYCRERQHVNVFRLSSS